MTQRITVVGAGVIGLSVAHELAVAGHRLSIVADVDTAETVSSVAAAVWFPYRSERGGGTDQMLERSVERFTDLSAIPDAGVDLRTGTVVERVPNPDRSWTGFLSEVMEATPDQLPPGARSGVRATVPVIMIPTYLPWLRHRVAEQGVTFSQGRVTDLSELSSSADAVIIAAGIRGGELLGGDNSIYPIRGQVVRLANPGLTEWITDEDSPDGLTYVFPRREDVIVGGTAIEGSWDTSVKPDVERAILARASKLVPAIAGQPILGRAAGLRPARETVRLEHVPGFDVPVIAAYGHGGAGVSLSWGTAERVRSLVEGGR